MLLCWLRSFTPVTSLSMLLGMRSLAAALQFEIYWIYDYSLTIICQLNAALKNNSKRQRVLKVAVIFLLRRLVLQWCF
ncbi:hypothetical protein F0L16_00105 [Photorhabdus heterorhabditis]|uniref:Uncharacterized protein n=1 Tax=Photorhabdus heterorhabditis TaxID=880156 RepID=A0A5B0XAM8_9GAMM|nr:hypothetical protein F0L16_00105 [Photorhabdus heterorhabditis]